MDAQARDDELASAPALHPVNAVHDGQYYEKEYAEAEAPGDELFLDGEEGLDWLAGELVAQVGFGHGVAP
jgi:hypothetical protein